jgi:glyoxylase-like metal-dependent hydrolase (beta-lactamase superfamily II)
MSLALLQPTPASGVWRLRLGWTQLYVLRNGTNFMLVDTGLCWERSSLKAALKEHNLTRCQGIVLTHGHCDHAGNAAWAKKHYKAPCFAHKEEAPFLETQRTYVPKGIRAVSAKGVMFAGGEWVYPVQRFNLDGYLQEDDEIATPAGVWRVIHTPGHTLGHISFFRESDGALLSGDALLNIVPFRQRNALSIPAPLFNSCTPQVFASARRLVALEPQIFLPGHGPPIGSHTAARLRNYAATLRF